MVFRLHRWDLLRVLCATVAADLLSLSLLLLHQYCHLVGSGMETQMEGGREETAAYLVAAAVEMVAYLVAVVAGMAA